MHEDIEALMGPLKKQIQGSMTGWLGEKSSDVSKRLENISSALQSMAENLEQSQENELAGVIRSGATSLKQVSSKVSNSEPQDILRVIEEQGSEHPAGAFVASLVAGFLSTRVTKQAFFSSEDEDFEKTDEADETDDYRIAANVSSANGSTVADHEIGNGTLKTSLADFDEDDEFGKHSPQFPT